MKVILSILVGVMVLLASTHSAVAQRRRSVSPRSTPAIYLNYSCVLWQADQRYVYAVQTYALTHEVSPYLRQCLDNTLANRGWFEVLHMYYDCSAPSDLARHFTYEQARQMHTELLLITSYGRQLEQDALTQVGDQSGGSNG